MKSFKDHIKSLSHDKIDYFITNSELNIFHEKIDNSVILSGSFNPLHYGHTKLLDYSSNKFDRNKFYEISISNVDKPDINIEDLISRLENFQNDEKIIITRSSRFFEKANLFPNSYFVIGYDTAIRVLDESYLAPDESLDDLFYVIKNKLCKFIVAGRANTTIPKFNNLNLNDVIQKYRTFFYIIEEKEFREDISSTEKRRQDN
ncbi:MAG: hypothetical protein CL745_01765 [Chloroflexi bacterium]|nr:hypothetical protein [Chloroflexota bacterium]|tara:strand:- start:652 stop:1263 length:612 start_codon:yes stop_codon:yes gene_type:complete